MILLMSLGSKVVETTLLPNDKEIHRVLGDSCIEPAHRPLPILIVLMVSGPGVYI